MEPLGASALGDVVAAVPWQLLAAVAVLGFVYAALLHAVTAAFEQLPYVEERALAERRRPDGRRTPVAWLASDVDQTSNSASVAYSILESVALVAWTLLAVKIGAAAGWGGWVVAGAAALVAAFVALMVVRAIPRQVARSRPAATVQALAWFVAPLLAASAPVRAVVPALRKPPLAEASDLVEQAQDALEDEDAELLRSVVNLGETLVREVMVPRTDMITIRSGTESSRAMRLFMRSGFSRVPVIGDGVDDLLGVVYLKDVIARTWEDRRALKRPVDDFMRDAVFVPESVPVDDLLRTMQRDVVHIAIVVDEFGGVAGLVTIEDALEEIVGELTDEHDPDEPTAIEVEPGRYRIPAMMPLDELGEMFDLDIDDDDVETAAGLLTKALDKVPIAGASATTHGLRLMAERTEGRRRRLAWLIAERAEDATE